MSNKSTNAQSNVSLSFAERNAYLLGRFIIIFSFVYTAVVFYTTTWRHYHIPKTSSFIFLMIGLFVCWAILAAGHRFVRSAHATPAAFFFGIIAFTSLFSVNLTEAWETILFYGACLFLSIMVPKFFVKLRDFQVFTYIMGLLSILVCLYALAQKFEWPLFYSFFQSLGINLNVNTYKPVSFMGNENYAAEYLNIALPICLMMIFCNLRRPAELLFYSFTTLLNICTMYYIDCNASYMGFAVAFPIVLLTAVHYKVLPWLLQSRVFRCAPDTAYRYFRHAIVLGLFAGVLVGTVIASFDKFGPYDNKIRDKLTQMATWVDSDGDNRPDGIPPIVFRLQCMDAAVRNIIDTPLFGIGAGNFKVIHPLYESQLERKVLGEETLARKVHNDHLHHAVEHGIFGLFAWYWTIAVGIYAIYRSLRFLNHQQQMRLSAEQSNSSHEISRHMNAPAQNFYFYLQLGILGGIITAVVSCAFGHTFVLPASAVTFWLVLGLGIAVFQKMHRYEKGYTTPLFGLTGERLTQTQHVTKNVPGWARWIALFLLVLPLGAKNTYQLIGESWLKFGMFYQDENKYQEVFYCFNRAKKIFPYQMEIYYILGRYYIDALVEIDNAINNANRIGDEALKRLAQINLFNYYPPKKANETDEQWQQRALAEPSNERMVRLQELRQRLIREGIVTLQSDIYMNPNYKWAHNNLGVIYDRLDNEHLSQAAYNRVLKIDEEQIYARYNLGIGYMQQGKTEQAVRSLEQALVVDPGRTDIYSYLTTGFIQTNDPYRALQAANRYLSLSLVNKIENQLTNKASVEEFSDIDNKINQGDLVGALKKILRYTELDASEADRIHYEKIQRQYLRIAGMLAQQGDNQNAEKSLRIAELLVSVPPSEFFYLYGEIYRQVGNTEKAMEHYQNYLRTNPGDIDARRQIASYFGNHRKFDEAANAYKPILENDPNWDDYMSYAQILLGGGKSDWNTIYSYIQKGIEKGGDTARKWLVNKENNTNLLYQYIEQDPRLQKLIGPKYWNPESAASIESPSDTQE